MNEKGRERFQKGETDDGKNPNTFNLTKIMDFKY